MMLSNVTVGAGVYCIAKATLYDFQKMGLRKFLWYIMAEGIGRKSPQLWVPVVDVAM